MRLDRPRPPGIMDRQRAPTWDTYTGLPSIASATSIFPPRRIASARLQRPREPLPLSQGAASLVTKGTEDRQSMRLLNIRQELRSTAPGISLLPTSVTTLFGRSMPAAERFRRLWAADMAPVNIREGTAAMAAPLPRLNCSIRWRWRSTAPATSTLPTQETMPSAW